MAFRVVACAQWRGAWTGSVSSPSAIDPPVTGASTVLRPIDRRRTWRQCIAQRSIAALGCSGDSSRWISSCRPDGACLIEMNAASGPVSGHLGAPLRARSSTRRSSGSFQGVRGSRARRRRPCRVGRTRSRCFHANSTAIPHRSPALSRSAPLRPCTTCRGDDLGVVDAYAALAGASASRASGMSLRRRLAARERPGHDASSSARSIASIDRYPQLKPIPPKWMP